MMSNLNKLVGNQAGAGVHASPAHHDPHALRAAIARQLAGPLRLAAESAAMEAEHIARRQASEALP
jgi:hypothetical protein